MPWFCVQVRVVEMASLQRSMQSFWVARIDAWVKAEDGAELSDFCQFSGFKVAAALEDISSLSPIPSFARHRCILYRIYT